MPNQAIIGYRQKQHINIFMPNNPPKKNIMADIIYYKIYFSKWQKYSFGIRDLIIIALNVLMKLFSIVRLLVHQLSTIMQHGH
jgi:hypothetical protein